MTTETITDTQTAPQRRQARLTKMQFGKPVNQ